MEMELTRQNIGVWLINLRQCTDRRSKMEKQIHQLGLDYTVFSALDGRVEQARLSLNVDAEAYFRNMGQVILPGKMGVYASHISVWESLVASHYCAGLVFEDDVLFHNDFSEALDTALAVAEDWDLVRFCCVRAKIPVSQGRCGRYRLNAYVGPFTGNAAYLIHRDVAKRLIPGLWPQTKALDHELNHFFVHDYRLRGLEPFSCRTDDRGISTITGPQSEWVNKPKWNKRLPYYRLKIANYFRRAFWLLRQGSIPGSRKALIK